MSTRKDPVAEFYRLKLEKIERRKKFWRECWQRFLGGAVFLVVVSPVAFAIWLVVQTLSCRTDLDLLKQKIVDITAVQTSNREELIRKIDTQVSRLDDTTSALFNQSAALGRQSIVSTSELRGLIKSQQGVISGLITTVSGLQDRVQTLEHPVPGKWWDNSQNATNLVIPLSPFTVTNYATPFYITTNSGTWNLEN